MMSLFKKLIVLALLAFVPSLANANPPQHRPQHHLHHKEGHYLWIVPNALGRIAAVHAIPAHLVTKPKGAIKADSIYYINHPGFARPIPVHAKYMIFVPAH